MAMFRRKPRRIKVLAAGRQGRTIHDELVDEFPDLPTVFTEAYPFEWPTDMEVTAAPESFTSERLDDEVGPPTDEQLVAFWGEQVAAQQAAKRDKKSGSTQTPE